MQREQVVGRRHAPHTRPHLLRVAVAGRAVGTRSRGQALVLLLPLLAVLCAALLLVFDSGQAVSAKQRLVNATDAAALSGATWQARTLNFEAYMTRAVVANEAAIAQSVSLRSWSAYMQALLDRIAVVTRLVPYLNVVTTALSRFWNGFDNSLQRGLVGLEGLLSLVDRDLGFAQRFMHVVALEVVPAAVRETLAANDPRYVLSRGGEALIARWALDWSRFTSLYGGAFRWRQLDVLERSLDGFTTNRRLTLSPLLGGAFLRFEKRGGTDLIDFETWRGLDTYSMHVPRGFIAGPLRELLPIAWAGAENGRRTALRGTHGGSRRVNPLATRLAERATASQRYYHGLPSLRALSVAQRAEFEPPRLVVRAALAGGAVPLAERIFGIAGLPAADGTVLDARSLGADRVLYAEAASAPRFLRPAPRADGARELPSLYSPYWSAHLVPLRTLDRALGAAVDGESGEAGPGAPEASP